MSSGHHPSGRDDQQHSTLQKIAAPAPYQPPSIQPSTSSGACWEIVFAFAVISIPLSILSAALLAIIFVFRIQTSPSLVPNSPQDDNDTNAYYVNLSATTIVLIASYSSTVAPLVVSYVMTLVSYSISSSIVRHSKRGHINGLPTPYQIGLLFTLRNGGLGSLWTWFKYNFNLKMRHRTTGIVKLSVVAAIMTVLLTLLITLADTWIHLATKSVEFIQQESIVPTQFSFGRRLSPYCIQKDVVPASSLSSHNPCSLDISLATLVLVGGGEAYKTLNNVSTMNQVLTGYDSTGGIYAFLGDVQSQKSSVDFVASTVAVNTQCKAISQSCNLSAIDSPVPYKCSDNFLGDLSVKTSGTTAPNAGTTFRMNFFNDSGLQHPTDSDGWPHGTNPVYIAMAAYVNDVSIGLSENGTTEVFAPLSSNRSNSDIVLGDLGGLAFILLCNTTVYDATYSWVNGSFSNFTQLSVANNSLASIVNGPQQRNATFGTNYLISGAIVSIFSPTAQALADKMALIYSQTALGISAGVFVSSGNSEEQTRQLLLVAKVPFAPLYTLIGLNVLYAAIGVLLALTALCKMKVKGVNSLFTDWGIIAQAFERVPEGVAVHKVEDLFQETRDGGGSVVGVERVGRSGNWRFKTWNRT